MNEELVVAFTPVRAAERVARWHGKIRTQLILLGIALVFTLGVSLWLRFQLPLMAAVLLVLLVAVPAVLAISDAVMFDVAKRDLASVGEGEALGVTRHGVRARGEQVGWSQLRRVWTRPGGVLRSSLLVVEHDGGTVTLPLDFVDRSVTDIDRAIRLSSSGRVAVEISPLEVVQRA